MIRSVWKTGRIMTVEEGCWIGGIGAEVAAIIVEEAHDALEAPVFSVTNPDAMIL